MRPPQHSQGLQACLQRYAETRDIRGSVKETGDDLAEGILGDFLSIVRRESTALSPRDVRSLVEVNWAARHNQESQSVFRELGGAPGGAIPVTRLKDACSFFGIDINWSRLRSLRTPLNEAELIMSGGAGGDEPTHVNFTQFYLLTSQKRGLSCLNAVSGLKFRVSSAVYPRPDLEERQGMSILQPVSFALYYPERSPMLPASLRVLSPRGSKPGSTPWGGSASAAPSMPHPPGGGVSGVRALTARPAAQRQPWVSNVGDPQLQLQMAAGEGGQTEQLQHRRAFLIDDVVKCTASGPGYTLGAVGSIVGLAEGGGGCIASPPAGHAVVEFEGGGGGGGAAAADSACQAAVPLGHLRVLGAGSAPLAPPPQQQQQGVPKRAARSVSARIHEEVGLRGRGDRHQHQRHQHQQQQQRRRHAGGEKPPRAQGGLEALCSHAVMQVERTSCLIQGGLEAAAAEKAPAGGCDDTARRSHPSAEAQCHRRASQQQQEGGGGGVRCAAKALQRQHRQWAPYLTAAYPAPPEPRKVKQRLREQRFKVGVGGGGGGAAGAVAASAQGGGAAPAQAKVQLQHPQQATPLACELLLEGAVRAPQGSSALHAAGGSGCSGSTLLPAAAGARPGPCGVRGTPAGVPAAAPPLSQHYRSLVREVSLLRKQLTLSEGLIADRDRRIGQLSQAVGSRSVRGAGGGGMHHSHRVPVTARQPRQQTFDIDTGARVDAILPDQPCYPTSVVCAPPVPPVDAIGVD